MALSRNALALRVGGVSVAAVISLTSARADTSPVGTDDGTQITMWSRAATQARAGPGRGVQRLPQEPGHPDGRPDGRLQHQGQHRRRDQRPARPAVGDVVFMPNWTSAGLFQDLTSRINALPFKDNIAPGAIMVPPGTARNTACRS